MKFPVRASGLLVMLTLAQARGADELLPGIKAAAVNVQLFENARLVPQTGELARERHALEGLVLKRGLRLVNNPPNLKDEATAVFNLSVERSGKVERLALSVEKVAQVNVGQESVLTHLPVWTVWSLGLAGETLARMQVLMDALDSALIRNP